ncbi:MAG TPA: CaiB/BaiF CoA-transferase family protein [Acidimicrobiia bacterium]|nr:CaiB/BaiF CoA-transferase family protein [Acidimicrobiia bacterium]
MLPLLDGIRILDLCKLIPGGLATAKLADLGAEVIKIEEPPLGDYIRGAPPLVNGLSYWDLSINRNKKSVGLNLKTDEGRRIFFELLQTADAVVEVSKPGTFDKLGIDYESLRAVKPDLVYCSITGYGQTGPYRKLPSHGKNIDAASAGVRVRRDENGRLRVGGSASMSIDLGSMHAALGVVSAIVHKLRTGEGQYLDISLWDAAVASNRALGTAVLFGGKTVAVDPFQKGSANSGPKYAPYVTKDDKMLLIAPVERKFWVSFCAVIGREDWKDRGDWSTRPMDLGTGDEELADGLTEIIATRTLEDWLDVLLAADVPAAPVLSAEDLADNPHTEARGIIVDSADPRYPDVKYLRIPIELPGVPFSATPPPALGEHTAEILGSLGYDGAARARLLAAGAIAEATS